MVLDHVHEIGSAAGVHGAGDQAQALLACGFGLFGRDGTVFDHKLEDAVAGFSGTLRLAVGRRVAVGSADDPGQKGGLAEVQVANVFAEISQRGFAEAVNGKAAAVAQVDFVGVELENLLLVEAAFQLKRDHQFGELAPQGALAREKEAARQLLGERACALGRFSPAKVHPGRAEHANGIKARVIEEALVFGREQGIHQDFRQVFEAHRAALLARAVEEIGQQLGLNLSAVDGGVVTEGTNLADFIAGEVHTECVFPVEERAFRSADDQARSGQLEPAGSTFDGRFGVAGTG